MGMGAHAARQCIDSRDCVGGQRPIAAAIGMEGIRGLAWAGAGFVGFSAGEGEGWGMEEMEAGRRSVWRELNSDRLLSLDSSVQGGGAGLKIWRSQKCVWGSQSQLLWMLRRYQLGVAIKVSRPEHSIRRG